MKDSQLILGDFFNLLPDAVIVVDSTGTIVFANAAVENLLGYAPEELLEQSLDILIPENFREVHVRHLARFREVTHVDCRQTIFAAAAIFWPDPSPIYGPGLAGSSSATLCYA